jgi:hypothetical protein
MTGKNTREGWGSTVVSGRCSGSHPLGGRGSCRAEVPPGECEATAEPKSIVRFPLSVFANNRSPGIPDAEDKSRAEIRRYGPYKILRTPRGTVLLPLGPRFPDIQTSYSPQTSPVLHYQPETLAFRSIFLR